MKKNLQPLTPAALYARVSSDRQDVDLSETCARERHFELLDGTDTPEDGRGEVRRDRHPDTYDPPSSWPVSPRFLGGCQAGPAMASRALGEGASKMWVGDVAGGASARTDARSPRGALRGIGNAVAIQQAAVQGDGGRPVEVLQAAGLLEAGALKPQFNAPVGSPAALCGLLRRPPFAGPGTGLQPLAEPLNPM